MVPAKAALVEEALLSEVEPLPSARVRCGTSEMGRAHSPADLTPKHGSKWLSGDNLHRPRPAASMASVLTSSAIRWMMAALCSLW